MGKGKKFTIGLLVSGIMDTFTVSVCQGVMKAAREAGMRLVIFPGKYLDRDLTQRKEILYEYQYNTIFSYAQKENVDAILVSASTIGCFTTIESIQNMLSRYAGIPCVLLASKIDGYVSVNFDNNSGIKEAMDYLIHELNCRKFGMIGGPDSNTDAYERKMAFLQCLEENNIPFREENCAEGILSRCAPDLYRKFLDKNPDIEAVFCVNDDTAVGLYEVLKEYKITPGKQIKIFGYDNILLATKLKPALSSVWADPVEMGEAALEMATQMLRGQEVQSRIIPTNFIRRDSFGKKMIKSGGDDYKRLDRNYIDIYFEDIFYRYQNIEDDGDFVRIRNDFRVLMENLIVIYEETDPKEEILEETLRSLDNFLEHRALDYADIEHLIEHIEKIDDLIKVKHHGYIFSPLYHRIILAIDQRYGEISDTQEEKNYEMKLFVKDIMDFEKGTDQSYMVLLEHLNWLGIQNAYIYTFESPVLHLHKEEIVLPEELYLKAMLKAGEVQGILATSQKVKTADMFSNKYMEGDDLPKVLFPLFSNEMMYGVFLCDMTEKLFENGDFLVNQMSSAMKMIDLLRINNMIQRQLEESLITLKENNIVLDTLSKSDVLTGILNRRGFYDAAEKFMAQGKENGYRMLVSYVDMNNLKIINDRYGHDEGDFSIKKIGELLTAAVGKNGIVGRIGGDEFALIMSYEEEKDFVNEIYARFREFNETSSKPYNITVSAGTSTILAQQNISLKEALTLADERLYEEKQHRIKTVAKNNAEG